MKNTKLLIWIGISLLLLCASIGWIFFQHSLQTYQKTTPYTSVIGDSLNIFSYNESQHTDPVAGCWYDSGDYVIFLPRNVEALYYLSLARSHSRLPDVQADLDKVINQQLTCVEQMVAGNFKQFRDQKNHGVQLPPTWNEWFYPNNVYSLKSNEGKDIFLMLAQIYTNLNQPEKAKYHLTQAQNKQTTISSNCCELGPLTLEDTQIKALESLTNSAIPFTSTDVWGVKFSALATLAKHDYPSIQGSLNSVQKKFTLAGTPFHYLGGNYDIAGTIAFERLYARNTNDQSYRQLSDTLWNYLHGNNQYKTDFTNQSYTYHPCYFFHACKLQSTLVNGVDSPTSTPDRSWNTSEVQLVGQARYVLAQVLYLNY